MSLLKKMDDCFGYACEKFSNLPVGERILYGALALGWAVIGVKIADNALQDKSQHSQEIKIDNEEYTLVTSDDGDFFCYDNEGLGLKLKEYDINGRALGHLEPYEIYREDDKNGKVTTIYTGVDGGILEKKITPNPNAVPGFEYALAKYEFKKHPLHSESYDKIQEKVRAFYEQVKSAIDKDKEK